MKKSISFAIALIVVSTMILSSCVKAPAPPSITDSNSGINGSLDNTPGESNDVSNNGTDNGTNNGSNNENNNENNENNNGDNSGNNSGDNSGDNTGNKPGDNSGNNSGDNSGDNTGNKPGDNTGNKPGDNSGDNTGNNPGDNSGNNPGDNSGNKPGDNSGNNPGDNTGNNPGDNSGDSSEDDVTQTPTAEPTLNVNGTTVEWTLSEGIAQSFVTSSNAANTKFEMNIPVNAQGSYELGFDVNLGFTTTFTKGSKKATLSLPKTVFTESEPIPVAYSTSGLNTANNNRPWICVTKNVGGVDKYISWQYVNKNGSGIVDITAMTGARQDDSVLDYIWLDPGEYKIYLIDDAYSYLTDKDFWLHNDPINISIVPDGTEKTTVVRSGSAHGDASISVSNNIFSQGTPIKINYTASRLTTPSGKNPWLCLSKNIVTSTGVFDYYTHWDYTTTDEKSNREFTASNGNAPQDQVKSYKSLPVGSYKIHYINGSNLQNCIEYVEPIGINIAPAASIGAKLGGTSIWNTSNPYDIASVKQAVTVTEADVAKGYITVEFDLSSLSANTLYYLNIQNVSMAQK